VGIGLNGCFEVWWVVWSDFGEFRVLSLPTK
jgi:hypothetical protein